MYQIVKKQVLSNNTVRMTIKAPMVARRAMPGQFIILRVTDNGERIPLTISDYDREEQTVSIIFQQLGLTTKLLATKNEGEYINDFVGPLGVASALDEYKSVLCIGGGVGTAPLFPQIKYLHEKGDIHVDVILGARNKDLILLKDEIEEICDNVYLATDDGSAGHKGFVSDVMVNLIESGKKYEHVIAIGPLIMMKVVCDITKKYGIKTTVSMNPIMIDGTGMCGGCRVSVGGETKYACVDGPDFDGHLIDFDLAMQRQRYYKEEEQDAEKEHNCRIGLEEKK